MGFSFHLGLCNTLFLTTFFLKKQLMTYSFFSKACAIGIYNNWKIMQVLQSPAPCLQITFTCAFSCSFQTLIFLWIMWLLLDHFCILMMLYSDQAEQKFQFKSEVNHLGQNVPFGRTRKKFIFPSYLLWLITMIFNILGTGVTCLSLMSER